MTRPHPILWPSITLLLLLPLAAHAQPGGGDDQPDVAESVGAEALSVEERLELLQQQQLELRRQVDKLDERNMDLELDLIRMQAEAEAASGGEVTAQADEETKLGAQTFRGGQRALQALNPEISVVGDAFAKIIVNDDGYQSQDDRTGFVYRMVGLHFQADLDPFSFTKITAGLTPSGIGLGEAYITWTSILPNLSLTAGKFRQEFGVVNRWHLPGLDQYDFPVALRETFGPSGLNQTGLSLDWLMPSLWAHANQLVLQVTNGENEHLLAGKYYSIPTALLRLKSYYDLSESAYFELGLTGLLGWNNARGKLDEETAALEDEDWRTSLVGGADWSLTWEPLRAAKYRNVVARGELYAARKATPDEPQTSIGFYQQLETKVSRSWLVGARFDWATPLQAAGEERQHIWGVLPYVTWWQSPWVRMRMHYGLYDNDRLPEADHRIIFQVTAAAGPHKHERY